MLLFVSLSEAALEYATLYVDSSYVIQDIQVSNPENLLGLFDDSVAIMESSLSNNIFQGWESYGFIISDLNIENSGVISVQFSVRLNTTINFADDYLKLSYSNNEGVSWIGVDNMQPAFALTTFGNYTMSVSSISQLNSLRVKLQYIVIGSTDAELSDVIGVDGVEVYVTYNTTDPKTTNTTVNLTGVPPNTVICVNHTVTKGTYNINRTWVTVTYPDGTVSNISTWNWTNNCGGGGNVYEAIFDVGSDYGTFYVNNSWVNDSQGALTEELPHPDLNVLVRDDVLIVTLTGVPVCFGLLYPNDEYVQASDGDSQYCSENVEGFPMNVSIESNIPTHIWLKASNLTFNEQILELGNLSYTTTIDGNKTSLNPGYNAFATDIPAGSSVHPIYWWLYLNRYLDAGNYTTDIEVKVNRTY